MSDPDLSVSEFAIRRTTEANSFDDVELDYFVNGRWVHEHDLTEAERVAWLNDTLGVSDDA